jgi:hypothetical protein
MPLLVTAWRVKKVLQCFLNYHEDAIDRIEVEAGLQINKSWHVLPPLMTAITFLLVKQVVGDPKSSLLVSGQCGT